MEKAPKEGKKDKKEKKDGKEGKKDKKEKKDKENSKSKDANSTEPVAKPVPGMVPVNKDKKEKKEKKDKGEKKAKDDAATKAPVPAAVPAKAASPMRPGLVPIKKDKKDKKDKKSKEEKKDKKHKKDEKDQVPHKTSMEETLQASAPPAKKARTEDEDEEAGDFWKEAMDNMFDFIDPVSEAKAAAASVDAPEEAPDEADADKKAAAQDEVDEAAAAELFPADTEIFDPLAPRTISLSQAEVKLLTADGRRWLQRVESLAVGAKIEVDCDGGEARIEGEEATAIERGFLCFKGMLTSLQGDFVEVSELPEADDEHLSVVHLPQAAGTSCIHPKKMIEAFEVIAAFVQEKLTQAPPKPKPSANDVPSFAKALGFNIGQAVEGRYEDVWYHGEIVGFSSDNGIIVQWFGGGEDAQAELSPVDVRPSKVKALPELRELRPGCRLLVFGGARGRMAAVLQAMAAIERKVPCHFSEKNPPQETSEMFGFGLKLFQLPVMDGGAVARQRSKIAAASEAIVEVLGKYVAIAGESDERCRAEALALQLVPHVGPFGDAAKVPDELVECCSYVRVPSIAVKDVCGANRVELDSTEDETGTIAFWLPVGTDPPKRSVSGTVDIGAASVEVGCAVKGKYEGEWHPATVLSDGAPGKVKITWDFDGSQVELPFAEVRFSKTQRDRQLWLKTPRVLAIIGPEKKRREASLRVLAASEWACPGLWSGCISECLSEVRGGLEEDEVIFGVEAVPHDGTEAELEWATSPAGLQALRRAAAAAGCAVDYIKRNAIVVGFQSDRQRGIEYVKWTIQARREGGVRRGTLSVPDADMREDISIIGVPESRAQRLRPDRFSAVERETSTIALFDDGGGSALSEGHRRLLICGGEEASRELAGHRIQALLEAAASGISSESSHTARSDDRFQGSQVEEKPAKLPKVEKSDPKEVLAKMDWPSSINQWGMLQKKVWWGHSPLPKGWIRVWSKSQDKEYYLRTKDMKTTFELKDVRDD